MTRLKMMAVACGALLALLAAGPAGAQDKPSLIVGAVYVGSVNDYGYNRSMKDGLDEMKRNIPGLKLIEAENVPETAEVQRVMEGMIQQGAKLIFATSFGYQQFAFNLAKTHPDVYFEHAGGWMQAPNFGNFFGATQSAWYAMGVAAGKMTKSNTLGFVVGVPIGYALGNVNAFELGARSVNPKAQTHVVVTGGWSDKAKEAAAANALIDQGADVVTMHVDSPATIIQVAESRKVYSIGFQSIEARQLAPKYWITGSRLHLGPVHDRYRQERDRGHLQARDGARRARPRHDGDCAVWPGGAAPMSANSSPPPPTRSSKVLIRLPVPSPTTRAWSASRPAKVVGRRQDGQLRLVRRRCHRQSQITSRPYDEPFDPALTLPPAAAALGCRCRPKT